MIQKDVPKPHKRMISPVTAGRLVICCTAAAAAVVIKLFGGGIYESARSLYEEYAIRSFIVETERTNEAFISSAQHDYSSR